MLSVPLRQIACKKVRYLIWKVKSTRYDASDIFRQADLRWEERQMVEPHNSIEDSTNTVRPNKAEYNEL